MKRVVMHSKVQLCIMALVYFTLPRAQAVLVVVPNSYAEVLGTVPTAAPFGFDLQLCRVQEAYDSSQFSFLGTNGGFINTILFRFGYGPGFFRPPNGVIHYPLTINLSTASNGVNNLSTVFDQNTGADKVTVFSSTFNFSSLTGVGVVEPFGMVIPLSTPFFYNPTNGALLVDILVGLTDEYYTGPADMDAVSSAGNGVSTVWHVNDPYDTTIPTNGALNAYSLVTQFDILPVNPLLPGLTLNSLPPTNMVLAVTNGSPGTLFSVLTTTNMSLSANNWVSIVDNAIIQNGVFYLTNPIAPNVPQRFYRLKMH